MNRDLIEPGKTGCKFAEALALFGGVGALLYPLVFWYVGYISIFERDDFYTCNFKKIAEHKIKNEDYEDHIRSAMFYNCVMMAIYLGLHYTVFARPESYRTFKIVGYIFAVVLAIECIVGVINFILVGISICNTESYATAALLSSIAIILINLVTLLGAVGYFGNRTRVRTTQVASAASDDRSSLVK